MSRKTWSYILWPVIVFNTMPVCLFGGVFALTYQRGGNMQSSDLTGSLFWLYIAVFIINWLLAIFVLRKYKWKSKSVRELVAADGEIFKFNWKPALVLFAVFNRIIPNLSRLHRRNILARLHDHTVRSGRATIETRHSVLDNWILSRTRGLIPR